MSIKISFVIPAHNEERYLGKCLASIIEQTRKNGCEAEIVVVNNASTDNTRQVALSFRGVRVVDEPRKGLSQARQTGFLASSGELIANIDADVLMPDGWIKKVLENFQADRELLALSGPHVLYDLSNFENFLISIYYRFAYFSYVMNRFILNTGSLVHGGNFVIRKTALEKIGGFDPAFTFYGEDTDIARRLHKIGKVKFTLKLPIYASGRRIKTEGMWKMVIIYPLNYFWTLLFRRPFSKTYTTPR